MTAPCLSACVLNSTVPFATMAAPNAACRLGSSSASGVQAMNFRQTALSHRTSSTRSNSTLRVVSELTVEQTLPGGRTRSPKVVKPINMVDPIEAKRLAAEEWKQLQSRSKLKRQRRIEAINGGWAMLGLTAGVVVEGYTGKGILLQVADYLDSVADFLSQFLPDPPV